MSEPSELFIETVREDEFVYSKLMYVPDEYTMMCFPLEYEHVLPIVMNDLEETWKSSDTPQEVKDAIAVYAKYLCDGSEVTINRWKKELGE
jgi:hypothetical protein